jgi:carboxypeptidase C (cathepsin A)
MGEQDGAAEQREYIMDLASARARSAGLRAVPRTLALAASLCLASLPGAAQEATGKAGIRIPIGEIDEAPLTPLAGRPLAHGFAKAEPKTLKPLPAEASRHRTLDLPDRRLAFTLKAGAVAFEDEKGAVVAEIGYFAYLLDGADAKTRPITFAINGGPGSASAWLHLGALGPWRLPIAPEAARPTAPADLLPNAETWLDFTDLVFIDPVGTGYTRLHPAAAAKPEAKDGKAEADAELRKAKSGRPVDPRSGKFFSVQGDIASIAVFMKRWLEANGRTQSPKVFLGESYGGFRAPRIARSLQEMPGFALNGIVMVSPALSGWGFEPGFTNVMLRVAQFPSLAAAIADARGPVSAAQLAAFEREAAGPYMADLLAGPRDTAAVERLAQRIVAVTGLDAETVRILGPRSRAQAFLGAVDRKFGRTHSIYDATFKRDAAYDGPTLVDGGDDLGGLSTQLARGMAQLDKLHLAWSPGRKYLMRGQGSSWTWYGQESVSSLRSALVRDPTFRVLIAHGYADLVTPYFRTRLTLGQLPTIGTGNRVRLEVYGGGHMFYSRDDARARFRRHAVQFYEELAGSAAKG